MFFNFNAKKSIYPTKTISRIRKSYEFWKNSEKIIRNPLSKINVKATTLLPELTNQTFIHPFENTLYLVSTGDIYIYISRRLNQHYNTKIFFIKFISSIPSNIFPRASITKAPLFAMILAIFPSEITSLCKLDGNI